MKALRISAIAVAALFALTGPQDAAADSSAAVAVSVGVLDACTFGTITDITFATDYQPGQTNTLGGTGSFVIDCTVTSQAVTLTPNGGLNPGGTAGRQLVHGTNSSSFLTYSVLVTDPGSNQLSFDAGAGLAQTLGNGANTFGLDAIISASQTAIGGTYGDSITIAMAF